ncbi:MAG TPA: acyl-CoA carboxylase subunit epsilon [Actinomycetes bacterium]|nr:acyl-CoA carboxylase subunit epsilon [Actinomycetes bacterium]
MSADPPSVRVVRGHASDEEVAALVAALAVVAARQRTERRPQPARSWWARPSRNIRPPLGPGRGSWLASGYPR